MPHGRLKAVPEGKGHTPQEEPGIFDMTEIMEMFQELKQVISNRFKEYKKEMNEMKQKAKKSGKYLDGLL